MTLISGTKLGPYQIVAPLGAGGMGEVYRARDTRLGRDVAVKVLPQHLSSNPELRTRFEREAKTVSSLNHPNICTLFDVGREGETDYLVMELIEGETLAQRLAKGALPTAEVLRLGAQIADALDRAHRAGVVHRDLKPGNVMLTRSGAKLMDFGLARATGLGGSSGSGISMSAMTQSPSAADPLTAEGTIVGTFQYMAPEQLEGREVDARSDIWALGCVLYEMATGRRTFEGTSQASLIAAIMHVAPAPLSQAAPMSPLALDRLVAACLVKDPTDRVQSAHDVKLQLGWIADDGSQKEAALTPRRRSVPVWAAAAVTLAFAALATTAALRMGHGQAPTPIRMFDLVADGVEMDWFFMPQLSPDGRRIAYVAKEQVWVRDLEQLEPRAVADVAGLTPVCWSPDSHTLVYNDVAKLWKASVDGGAPLPVCEVPGSGNVIGAAISRSGTLAFAVWRGGMYQVPISGGAPSLLFDIDPDAMIDFHAPSWLPNGDLMHVVHWREGTDSSGQPRSTLGVFDGTKRIPIEGEFGRGSGIPTPVAGKLLYVRHDANAGIWSVSYNVGQRRVTGNPILVAAGAASLSASENGSLLYMEGNDEEGLHQLVWVDRSGKVIETVGVAHPGLSSLALSPDGQRVAFTTSKSGNEDIWVRDLAHGLDTRITFAATRETNPLWLDPLTLYYTEIEDMTSRIFAVSAGGSGEKRLVAAEVGAGRQEAILAPSVQMAVRIFDDGGKRRLRSAPILPDGSLGPPVSFIRMQPEPIISDARLAPNTRLLAYSTDDPGQPEVFLTRFPSGEGRWQVSSEGARRPRWAATSGELFYIGGGGPSRRALVAVRIDAAQDPPVGTSTHLFDLDPRWLRFGEMPYDVTPDGQRLLLAREARADESRPARMVLVQNWEAGLAMDGGQ